MLRASTTPTAFCAAFPGSRGKVKNDDPVKGLFKAVGAERPAVCTTP